MSHASTAHIYILLLYKHRQYELLSHPHFYILLLYKHRALCKQNTFVCKQSYSIVNVWVVASVVVVIGQHQYPLMHQHPLMH